MKTLIAVALGLLASTANAQMKPTPPRDTAMAAGPYETLVIRGATNINGYGRPPYGPAELVTISGQISDICIPGSLARLNKPDPTSS